MQQNTKKNLILYIILICLILLVGVSATIIIYKYINKNQAVANSEPYTDKFITALPVDLNQVASISKFRSCSGHDYSSANTEGQQETNRSMKHYINPVDSLIGSVNTIKVFSPFDGTVAAITPDAASNVQVGLQVWLTPTASPTWSYIYYHITPFVKVGSTVKSGELIGYANLSRTSVIDFDIALEAWVNNVNNPLGPGNLGNLKLALEREPNYLQLLHTGQLDSIFNHMDPEVLAQFATKGVTQQNIIVSKDARDISPCPQATNNGHYESSPGDNVIVQ